MPISNRFDGGVGLILKHKYAKAKEVSFKKFNFDGYDFLIGCGYY